MSSSTPLPLGLPAPGDLLAGRYRIGHVLGLGGMGGVFAAEDTQIGARVALKVMLPHLADNPEFIGRFMREAKAASSLTTPYVAQVYDIGRTSEGAPFMVMELLEGRDLDKILRARGTLPVGEAVGYVLEACHAIAQAHAGGIVHRDLKPSNLFVAGADGPRPVVKLLDFGISKVTPLDGAGDGLTATDTALGSPQYMSPEQVRSPKHVDQRTDIWSLGIILHKLLTGKLAFDAETMGARLIKVVTDPPTPLRMHKPDAPIELERVILRCLQKDPKVRFQNVGQLALALAPFVAPSTRPLIDAIVTTCGRDASFALLPPLPEAAAIAADAPTAVEPRTRALSSPGALAAAPDPGTAPGWTPARAQAAPGKVGDTPMRPRRGMFAMGVVAGVCVIGSAVAVAARQGAQTAQTAPAAASAGALPAAAVSSAPAPSATATAAAAPSAATAAREVRLTLELDPKRAEVELDGVVVHDNPLRLPAGDRVHKLTVRAPGFLPESRDVSSQSDATLHVTLHKQQGGRTKLQLETNL